MSYHRGMNPAHGERKRPVKRSTWTARAAPTDPRTFPAGQRRFTAAEYLRMAEDGYFKDQRVELLEGVIFEMSPQNDPHFTFISRVTTELVLALGRAWAVRVQLPLFLGPDSVPEPDLAVIERAVEDAERPTPHSAKLILEVADSSEAYDLSVKTRISARAGIPEYCVARVRSSTLEVYAGPQSRQGTYRTRKLLKGHEVYTSKVLPQIVLRLGDLFG